MSPEPNDLEHVSAFLEFFTQEPHAADFLEIGDNSLHNTRYEWPVPDPHLKIKMREIQALSKGLDERLPRQTLEASAQHSLDYAQALNPQQLAAVACTQGPLLALAGAGSGKTRTLVHRLSYLLDLGVKPGRILLLTFTRRAALEMLERAQLLNPQRSAHQVMGGTFHSFCAYLLRRLAPLVQLSPQFTIIDTVDSADVIDLIVQELKLRGKDRAFPRKNKIQDIISRSRNSQKSLEQTLAEQYPDLLEAYLAPLQLIAKTYAAYKRGNHMMDYDDLIEFTRDQLRDNPPFARKARSLFDYIMVDEYQDTNLIQKDLADYLAAEHRNIMVVGDDAQSIYGFRGANYENILRFPQTWQDCHVVRLEENYRSTQPLLDFSNGILSHNTLGFPKRLFSQRKSGDLPQVTKVYSTEDEAVHIAEHILQAAEQVPFHEMAVLYRSGFHSNFLQAELIKRNIPFVVYGGIRFTERRHIKDLVAYLRLLLNPFDAIAWHRLLQLLPGIGRVTARRIIEHIRQEGGQLRPQALGNKKFVPALQELATALQHAKQLEVPAAQLQALRNHYQPLLKGVESDWLQRLPDLEILLKLADKYEKLEKFLTDFALDPPSQQFQDQSTPVVSPLHEKPLVLSTVHSAKGLEWKHVYVMHLLDGLFPSNRSLKEAEALEEERRLFYVAASRAKDQLFLSLPSYYASYNDFFTQPSRFLGEMSPETYTFSDSNH